MKTICLLLLAAIAAVSAAPSIELVKPPIRLISRDEIHKENGEFNIVYVTENGITVRESGHLVPTLDGKDLVLIKDGSYEYIGDDNKLYKVVYSAGLEGFLAEGAHLPKSVVA